MEPTLPSPHGSPEMGPPVPVGPESIPAPEQGGEQPRSPERPAPQEQQTGAGAQVAPPMPTVPLPVQPAPTQPQDQTYDADDDNPAVASDEDLIEKEWVEKTKKIISETKHDPYAQEQAISRLQADYIRKRYGKDIRLPEDI